MYAFFPILTASPCFVYNPIPKNLSMDQQIYKRMVYRDTKVWYHCRVGQEGRVRPFKGASFFAEMHLSSIITFFAAFECPNCSFLRFSAFGEALCRALFEEQARGGEHLSLVLRLERGNAIETG